MLLLVATRGNAHLATVAARAMVSASLDVTILADSVHQLISDLRVEIGYWPLIGQRWDKRGSF